MIRVLGPLAFCLAVLAFGVASAETVQTRLGDLRLNAHLAASSDWPSGKVVLLTHGTLAHARMEIMQSLQDALLERGVSSLSINLSYALDDRAAAMYDCPDPHRHLHTDGVAEIAAWIGWLQSQGVDRLAILGHSRGGNQVARYAMANPQAPFSHVALLAPATWEPDEAGAGYAQRYGRPLGEVLEQAMALQSAGKGAELLGPLGFIYCADTRASADAVISYYAPDPDMDTPSLLPRIGFPVLVIAGSEDTVVEGLVEKTERRTDGDRVRLTVIEGADHFFLDLYAEDVVDALVDWLGE